MAYFGICLQSPIPKTCAGFASTKRVCFPRSGTRRRQASDRPGEADPECALRAWWVFTGDLDRLLVIAEGPSLPVNGLCLGSCRLCFPG